MDTDDPKTEDDNQRCNVPTTVLFFVRFKTCGGGAFVLIGTLLVISRCHFNRIVSSLIKENLEKVANFANGQLKNT